ncbi:Beclin-1 [Drechslerella dactyloides]|uniref:Beclin-1 n=1 Tax=Drechslerella dactyloides TaxID=74499 RepID=A0AAD6NLM5_DREDA|nr:Beclin-1 [Drechslerella dactyloides]
MAEMFCQQCRTPLKLHGSLQNLNSAALNLLHGSSAASQQSSKQTSSKNDAHPVVKRSVPNAPKNSSPLAGVPANMAESFVMLSDSVILRTPQPIVGDAAMQNGGLPLVAATASGGITPEDSLSHKMQTSRRLFDVLSARSDIDYPICTEDGYQQFLKKLQADVPSDEEARTVEQDLAKARREKDAALAELEELERVKAEIEAEIAEAEAESKRLEVEEEEFWQERNTFAQQLEEYQNERDSVNLRYDYDSKQLERLHRTNVYNDTFCIGHDGFFGTINGLRLGKLPSQPVEWAEINAAWGQTLLLLHTVADKLGFVFENYRLKPMGSTSKIEKLETRHGDSVGRATNKSDVRVTVLELFSSGTIPMGHLFAHRKFDGAMVVFLDCIRQLGEFVARADPTAVLPYTIVKDKIGDVSIRLTFNQDEPWTKACKYTLTCAKFLLAYASNQGLSRRLQAQQQLQALQQQQQQQQAQQQVQQQARDRKKKHKVKVDLTEHHRDKRKMGKNVDPSRAITEEEPWAIAQQAGKGISQMRHKDQYGNDIVDPDRSNPTRHRMERPLETIRSFERAIYNDFDREFYPPRRSNRNGAGSTYEQPNSQRASMAYQYGDQSARQSTYNENFDGGSSYSQRQYPPQQHRNSGYENGSSSRHRADIPSDAHSGTYSNGGGSGWSGDPYSTNPSSDASYEQQQQQQQQQYAQSGRLPLGTNDKPLPNVNRYSGGPPPVTYQNGYASSSQQQPQPPIQFQQAQYQQQQNGFNQQPQQQYTGHSQFAPAQNQYRQANGQQQQQPSSQPAWDSQPTAGKTVVTKSSAAADGKAGGEKRRSWFRRSKS